MLYLAYCTSRRIRQLELILVASRAEISPDFLYCKFTSWVNLKSNQRSNPPTAAKEINRQMNYFFFFILSSFDGFW